MDMAWWPSKNRQSCGETDTSYSNCNLQTKMRRKIGHSRAEAQRQNGKLTRNAFTGNMPGAGAVKQNKTQPDRKDLRA